MKVKMDDQDGFSVADILELWALNRVSLSSGMQNDMASVRQRVEISWNTLKFFLSDCKWSDMAETKTPTTQPLFGENYYNSTNTSTEHTVKFDKKTQAICTVKILEGQAQGLDVLLPLTLPEELIRKTRPLEAFGNKLEIGTDDVTQTSSDMTWTVDSSVITPAHSVTNVNVVVRENTFEANFTGIACLAGRAVMNVFNIHTDTLIMKVEDDISDILRWYTSRYHCGVAIKNRTARWNIRGVCHFQYGEELWRSDSHVPLSQGQMDLSAYTEESSVISTVAVDDHSQNSKTSTFLSMAKDFNENSVVHVRT